MVAGQASIQEAHMGYNDNDHSSLFSSGLAGERLPREGCVLSKRGFYPTLGVGLMPGAGTQSQLQSRSHCDSASRQPGRSSCVGVMGTGRRPSGDSHGTHRDAQGHSAPKPS